MAFIHLVRIHVNLDSHILRFCPSDAMLSTDARCLCVVLQ